MKTRDIEIIRRAAEALRTAIRLEVGPTQLPPDNDALCDAVDAVIEAVLMEMHVELVRSDKPAPSRR
jgi:hypothetical protein